MRKSDRSITGFVYSIHFKGRGGHTSNDGEIQISPDGKAPDADTVYLTGPSETVTIEEYLAIVGAINYAYCYRRQVVFAVRDRPGDNPLLQSVTLTLGQ